jgi:hypothetical protein
MTIRFDLTPGFPPRAPLRLGCTLSDSSALSSLRDWLSQRLASAELFRLPLAGSGLEVPLEGCDVLLLERPTRATIGALAAFSGSGLSSPELILIGAEHPIPEELRDAGFAVAFQLSDPCPVERLGQAILDTLAIHQHLRESCQRAVGKLAMRDALALVRLYMLREACGRTSSKRAAARELGVTRPAVQQMLRLRGA